MDGRDEVSDYSDYEYDQSAISRPQTESKEAWAKSQFTGADISEKKRRREKRDERKEREKLEELDADERIADFHKLLDTYQPEER